MTSLKLYFSGTFIKLLFALKALMVHGRATHRNGVAGAGRLKVVGQPEFPAHEFFRAGREFPVFLRHANLQFADDAALDIRGCAIKLSDTPDASPLDIIMNTGATSAFWNTPVFLDFVKAKSKGKEGLIWFAEKYPLGHAAALGGLRREPSSFARLRYYSQIVYHFRAQDNLARYVKYRVIPGDRSPEDGLPTALDQETPWEQARLDGVSLPEDYLRQEFRERLVQGSITYLLQIQLHTAARTDTPEVFHSGLKWDETTHPWLDLAEITLDRTLTAVQAEELRFNIANQPSSLGVISATSLEDYNSLGYLRTRVYRFAQAARRISRKKAAGRRA